MSSRSSTFRVPSLALVLAGLWLAGCGGDGDGEYLAVRHDLLRDGGETGSPLEPPAAVDRLPAGSLVERRAVFRQRLDAGLRKALTWQVTGDHEAVDDGLLHRAGGEPLVFEHHDLGEQGRDLSAVTVRLRNERLAAVRLFWAGPDEGFDDERTLRRVANRSPPGRWHDLVFELREHPQWRERIDRLRVVVKVYRDTAVVRRLDVERDVLVAERLAPHLHQPRRVELDDEVRPSLASLTGLSIRRDVEVPEGGVLRFAYGVLHGGETPVAFEVAANGRVLFRDEVARRPGALPSWRRAEVDLGELAGRRVELELRNPLPGARRFDGDVHAAALRAAELSATRVDGVALWAQPEILAPVAGPVPANLVLVSYDTLRSDRMSLYGNPRPTTPNLDRWAAELGAVFDHAVAAAPWTLPSHTSMLTGLEAFRHGVNLNSPAPAALDLLPELLRERGYRTLAVTGGAYLSPDYGLDQGFDRFRYWPGTPVQVRPGQVMEDDVNREELASGMEHALAWLGEHAREPFFLFFHTYELHNRSRPRQPWFDQWSEHAGTDLVLRLAKPPERADEGFERRRVLQVREPGGPPRPLPPELAQLPYDLYDSSLAYADTFFGRLLERLDELGVAERTLVVFTSDHGEMLGEHGLGGHLYLYEENVLVPLVLAGPGVPAGRRFERQVRSIDLLPTVLDLIGVETPSGIDGRSLVPLFTDPAAELPAEAWTYIATSNYGASLRLRNRFKYTFRDAVFPPLHGREQVFDLERRPPEAEPVTGVPQQERWREVVRRVLGEQQAGLRVRFRAGDEPLEVVLAGSEIRTSALKSVDMGGPWITWSGPVHITARVPAARSFVLQIVSLRRHKAPFWIEHGGRRAWRLEPEQVPGLAERPLWVAWDGATWRQLDAAPADVDAFVGLEVWWQGPAVGSDATPEDTNDELRRQLEALGYL